MDRAMHETEKGEKKKRNGTSLRDLRLTGDRNASGKKTKLVHATRAMRGYQKLRGFIAFQKVGVFSYTGSFSLKGRKWSYGTTPTMGLSFRTLGLFLDSSELSCEGWYPSRL